jgi:hypothetical protein
MMQASKNVSSALAVRKDFSAESGKTSEWHALRRAIDPKESHLRARSFKWLATLPANVRPMATARQYARIVNRICDLWTHCEFTRLHFQSLLIDRRPGREGFPAIVKDELEILQNYYFEHLSGLPAILWTAVPVIEPKIPRKTFASSAHPTEIDLLPL